MTSLASILAALLAAAAATAGGVLAGEADGRAGPAPRVALVIDAAAGRDGRELLDPRLAEVDAEVRLPRTSTEALTNVRYFAAQRYRLVVAGPRARAAARTSGVPAVGVPGLAAALAAAAR